MVSPHGDASVMIMILADLLSLCPCHHFAYFIATIHIISPISLALTVRILQQVVRQLRMAASSLWCSLKALARAVVLIHACMHMNGQCLVSMIHTTSRSVPWKRLHNWASRFRFSLSHKMQCTEVYVWIPDYNKQCAISHGKGCTERANSVDFPTKVT